IDVRREVDAERAAAAAGQDIEIAARLGGFHDAEGEDFAGDFEVARVIAGDLKEDAGVRSAFVGLAGGMEEAGAETEAGGGALRVPHGEAHVTEAILVFAGHVDIGEEREIIASLDAVQVSPEDAGCVRRL